jgi:hypothetical protein
MNKKLLFIGVALFLLLLVVWLIFFRGENIGSGKLSKPPAKNEEAIEKRLEWLQSNMWATVFTTREDPDGAKVEDKQMAHIVFTSFFSFSPNGGHKVKKIEVKPVIFTQSVGTQVAIQPAHEKLQNGSMCSYIFTAEPTIKYRDIGNGTKTIVINGVEEQNVVETHFDEVSQYGGTLNFALVSKNLGTVSQLKLLDEKKVYESTKVLEYLGISAEQLNGQIVLDFRITFDDGKVYNKRFSGSIEGNRILTGSLYQVTMAPQ